MRLASCLNQLTSLLRNRAGNVAMMSALVMFALLGITGVAIDFSRAEASRAAAQNGLDSAALAVAQRQSTGGASDSELTTLAKDVFAANVSPSSPATCILSSLTRSVADGWVLLKFGCELKTTFGTMVGLDEINFTVASKTVYGGGNVEVGLVLDITQSMSGTKIADLITAATDLVNTVVKDNQTPFYSKVALVPYSFGVNVGSYAASARGPITNGTCTTPGCQTFEFTNAGNYCTGKSCKWTTEHPSARTNRFTVSTCVTERLGTNAYTDVAPGAGNYVGRSYPSSAIPCNAAQITPLSSNKTTLVNQIKALKVSGSTAGHIGLAWGWYMVSPNWGSLWSSSAPAAYDTKNLTKVVVLMTDGEFNSTFCDGVLGKDSTVSTSFLPNYDRIDCNANSTLTSATRANRKNAFDQAKELCKNMKDKKIVIYTVGFDLDSIANATDRANARDVLATCATSAGHFKDADDGVALKEAFKAIATEINQLRVAQ